jgi:hypothetical protein
MGGGVPEALQLGHFLAVIQRFTFRWLLLIFG